MVTSKEGNFTHRLLKQVTRNIFGACSLFVPQLMGLRSTESESKEHVYVDIAEFEETEKKY
jgi:hypothetical protein